MKTIFNDHAFPVENANYRDTHLGLTKREYFACAIMSGMASQFTGRMVERYEVHGEHHPSDAECAVELADALIEALNKKEIKK